MTYIFRIIVMAIVCLAGTAFGQRTRSDSVQALLQEAGGKVHRKLYPEAIEKYNKVLTLDPNNVQALRTLGTIFVEMRDNQLAREYFDRAFKIDPLDPALNNNLGALASGDGKSEDAIRFYKTAVRFDSTTINYQVNLALEYAKLGQNGNAMPLLKHIDSVSPNIPMVLFSLGNCYASLQKYDTAEVYFDKSVATGEKVDQLYYHRATVKKKLGKHEQAEKDYLTALQLNPKHSQCRQSLGMFYINQRRFADAAKQFETLTGQDSTYMNGWIGLGAAYSLAGRIDDGDKVLQRLFAKDSSLAFQMMQFIGTESNKIREEKNKK